MALRGEGRLSVTTRSEAIRLLLHKEKCPYVLDCMVPVTKNFFDHICNSSSYTNCHYFAKRVGELSTPMEWLQKYAVHESDQVTTLDERKVVSVDTRS
jgi:hypothetical protein